MDSNTEKKNEKRNKLLLFASATLIFLSLAALYFEVLYTYEVPFFVRVILAAYWTYSLVGIVASKFGSDELVSKMYLNVNRDYVRQ